MHLQPNRWIQLLLHIVELSENCEANPIGAVAIP